MPLRLRLRRFWRYRPRVLTVLLLFVVAAPIAMANFTSEMQVVPRKAGRISIGDIHSRGNYGWPFVWHWHNIGITMGPDLIVSWEYSRARLAANLASWIIMLAVPAAACEWLLRRYRPRLRWSLRTMLAAVAVAAVFCAWFAAARRRANLQDPIIAELRGSDQAVVERPGGPKWLEFVVPDNLRRHVVGLDTTSRGTVDEEFVVQLGRLPHLQYLNLHVERLTPSMAAALRQLRWLQIKENQPSRESLTLLGELTQLEGLCLYGAPLARDSLPRLARLTNLKMLRVEICSAEQAYSQMPVLPCLEAIVVKFSMVRRQDLRRLSVLPCLKALDLKYAGLVPDPDLRDLAGLKSLEELAIDGDDVTAAGLESLAALKHLKGLHISDRSSLFFEESDVQAALTLDDGHLFYVHEREVEGLRRVLNSLRQSHPGIVIDGNVYAIERRFRREPPWNDIRSGYKQQPPWDRIESLTSRSTWLPASMGWLPPSYFTQAGGKASGPSSEGAKQEPDAEGED